MCSKNSVSNLGAPRPCGRSNILVRRKFKEEGGASAPRESGVASGVTSLRIYVGRLATALQAEFLDFTVTEFTGTKWSVYKNTFLHVTASSFALILAGCMPGVRSKPETTAAP